MARPNEDAPQGAGGSVPVGLADRPSTIHRQQVTGGRASLQPHPRRAVSAASTSATSAAATFRAAIVTRLGHAPEDIEPDKLVRFSTNGRRSDSAGWCKLFADGRAGVFGDWRSGVTETWIAHEMLKNSPALQAGMAMQVERVAVERENIQRLQWAANAAKIERLLAECHSIDVDDAAALYLRRRGFAGVRWPSCLLAHNRLPYWDDDRCIGRFPGMVARVVDAVGRTVALHRTFLTPEGRKADVPTVRKLTPAAGPLAGAAIPLAQPRHGCIGIAEGIETALAASCASGLPVAAACSAGNLASWHWPLTSRRIVVFADADKAGRAAADKLHARAVAAGLSAQVMVPSVEGEDWADVWAARTAMRAGLDSAAEVVR